MSDCTRIEALWIEPGTPFDAAAAANKYRPRDKQITPMGVVRIWDKAKEEGRLPPMLRPWNGFKEKHAAIVRELMGVGARKAS
jgi:hypothetical protein